LDTLSQAPVYVSAHRSHGQPILQVWTLGKGDGFRFRYSDGVEFVMDSAGRHVDVAWPPDMTLEDAATYFVGPILSFILRLRGGICLHASAVAVRGTAAAFMGPPSAGKSTLAATFARKGIPVLSDDVVALVEHGGHFWVQPGYPRVNLWPDSTEALFGSAESLPHITRGWDKRFLDLISNPGRFQATPARLGVLYLLAGSWEGTHEPRIEPLAGREALMALVSNTSVNYMLDASMRSREFQFLGRLISRVPMQRVFCSRLDDLDSLAAAILANWEARNASPRV
jgi:hypothetical protein